MSVDFLRSCYSSTWKLFKGRPEVTTRGYYYFSPPGTPHCPVPHNLGSRIWTSDEREPEPNLGEVTSAAQSWRDGTLVVPAPPAVVLGDARCLAEGETYPVPVIAGRTLLAGVDSRCWTLQGQNPPPFVPEQDVLDNQQDVMQGGTFTLIADGNWRTVQDVGGHPKITALSVGKWLLSAQIGVHLSVSSGAVATLKFRLALSSGHVVSGSSSMVRVLDGTLAALAEDFHFSGSFLHFVNPSADLLLQYNLSFSGAGAAGSIPVSGDAGSSISAVKVA